MTARIFRPSPNAMQSGRGKSKEWVLVHEPAAPREHRAADGLHFDDRYARRRSG